MRLALRFLLPDLLESKLFLIQIMSAEKKHPQIPAHARWILERKNVNQFKSFMEILSGAQNSLNLAGVYLCAHFQQPINVQK